MNILGETQGIGAGSSSSPIAKDLGTVAQMCGALSIHLYYLTNRDKASFSSSPIAQDLGTVAEMCGPLPPNF